jgi:hypothetical protein
MSTLTATQLQQQYIAYFGRPGDPAGLKYWLSSSSGVSSARDFADKIYAQDEYKTSTVGTKSTEAQVNQLYKNLFSREADAAGLLYWTGEIEAGNLNLSNVAYDLIWAASNPVAGNSTQATADSLILSNKVAAATAFTADIEASTSALLAYQPETTTPWKTGAAFEAGVTFISGISTSAHTASGVDSSVAAMITANTSAGSAEASKTLKFTTVTDTLTGGSGDDTVNGVLQLAAAADTGTTVSPGDSVAGGTGTDTIAIAVAGTTTADYTLSAVTTTGVEKVILSNFDAGTKALTVDTTLMSGLTTVGLSSSSASGDSIFSGILQNTNAELRNGAADLTLTYASSVVTGSADTQKLTVSNLSAGTFTADGMETIEVTSELVKSKIKNITSADLTNLTLKGSADLQITDALTVKTIDASAATGAVSLLLGSAAQTVTAGSGDDTIDVSTTLASTDTIKGGAGTDTLKITTSATEKGGTGNSLVNVSEFETISVTSTGSGAEVELDAISGITTLIADGNQKTITISGTNLGAGTNAKVTVAYNGGSGTESASAVDVSSTTDTVDHGKAATAVAGVLNGITGLTATATDAVVTVSGDEVGTLVQNTVITGLSNLTLAEAYEDVLFDKAAGTEVVDVYAAGKVSLRMNDASGSSDSATFNLKTLDANKAIAQTVDEINIANTESLTITSNGMKDGTVKTLGKINGGAALTSLTITGSDDLTISDVGSANSKLATIDASASTGDLTFSDSIASLNQTITTGSGNDSITFDSGEFTEDDVIDTGANTVLTDGTAGSDTVAAGGNLGSAVDDSVIQLANVENFNLSIAATAATYIDASKAGSTALNFSNDNKAGTVKVKNLGAAPTIGLGIGAVELFRGTTGTLDLALADETGTSDSITLDFSDVNAASTFTLKTAGIETLNIKGSKETGTAAAQTFILTDAKVTSIVATDGDETSGKIDTLDLGTLATTTTSVDSSGMKGILKAVSASGVGTTYNLNKGQAHVVTASTGDDTFTMGDQGTAVIDLSAGTGTDVLNTTISSSASDFTKVDGFETVNITVTNETSSGFDDATKDDGLNAATTVNVLGGNSLSTFVIGGTDAIIDDSGSITTLDASTFNGKIDVTTGDGAFDSSLTIKGSASTDDKVTITGSEKTDEKIASMTGVETLVVNSKTGKTAMTVDLTNVTGLTTLDAQFLAKAAADKVTIDKVPAGVTVKTTTTKTADNLALSLADASSTTTALTIEATKADDGAILNLDIADVEDLTIDAKTTGLTFDLAGVSATGTTGTTTLTLKGSAATLSSLNADINVIEGSQVTGAIKLPAADRPSTAMTITTGLGDDEIAMENAADVLTAGLGTDTLDVRGNGVLGGFAIDLSSTADQVTQYGGVVNSAAQTGFENVTVASITGSFGADITGTDEANIITGSKNNDILRGGKGDDTINAIGGGTDEVHTGAGSDDVILTDVVTTEGAAVAKTIKDFDVDGTDQIELSETNLESLVSSGNLIDIGTSTTAFAKTEDFVVTAATKGLDMGDAATTNLIALSHATAYTSANVLATLEKGGTHEIVANKDITKATSIFLLAYDDNVSTTIAAVRVKTADVKDDAELVSANLVLTELVTLEGFSNAANLAAGNFIDLGT